MCIRYYRERLFPIFGRKLTSDDGDAIYDYEMECEEAMELNYRNVNGYLLPELEYNIFHISSALWWRQMKMMTSQRNTLIQATTTCSDIRRR